jgi:hypothetical protein
VGKRALKTAYFLNRALGYLALIGERVRLPESGGVWILVADAMRSPSEVAELLGASYPSIDAHALPVVSLLTDFDVEEFEREMRESGRADQAATPVPVELPASEELPPVVEAFATAVEAVEAAVEGTVKPAEEALPLPATVPESPTRK